MDGTGLPADWGGRGAGEEEAAEEQQDTATERVAVEEKDSSASSVDRTDRGQNFFITILVLCMLSEIILLRSLISRV